MVRAAASTVVAEAAAVMPVAKVDETGREMRPVFLLATRPAIDSFDDGAESMLLLNTIDCIQIAVSVSP